MSQFYRIISRKKPSRSRTHTLWILRRVLLPLCYYCSLRLLGRICYKTHSVSVSACMLYTYATLMALILLVEVGLAVTVYVFKGDAREFVSKGMRQGMLNYTVNEEEGHVGVKDTW